MTSERKSQFYALLGLWLMVAFSEGWAATPLWQRVAISLGFAVVLFVFWPSRSNTRTGETNDK